MGKDDALRQSRGSGGVEDEGNILTIGRFATELRGIGAALAQILYILNVAASADDLAARPQGAAHSVHDAGVRQNDCRLHVTVGDKSANVVRGQAKIDQGRHGAKPLQGQQHDAMVECARQYRRNAIASADAALLEARRNAIDFTDQLAIGQLAFACIIDDRQAIRRAFR